MTGLRTCITTLLLQLVWVREEHFTCLDKFQLAHGLLAPVYLSWMSNCLCGVRIKLKTLVKLNLQSLWRPKSCSKVGSPHQSLGPPEQTSSVSPRHGHFSAAEVHVTNTSNETLLSQLAVPTVTVVRDYLYPSFPANCSLLMSWFYHIGNPGLCLTFADCRIADCRLQTTHCRLHWDYRLHTADLRP